MVLEGEYPPDIRIEKEARTLVSEGHKIFLLSLEKPGKKEYEVVEGINVIRINLPKSFVKKALKIISFSISFESKFWRKALEKAVKEHKIDVIHCHDLPLVKTTTRVARRLNIPIIADLHENFPEGVKAWRKEKISFKMRMYNRLIYPYPIFMYKRFEKSLLKKVDKIITVVDEAKEHYIKDCGISSDKITVVMNTENIKTFEGMEIAKSIVKKYRNSYNISFVGFLAPHRGIETAIRSMPKILEKIPNAKLLLIGGKGYEGYEDKLIKLCKELKVTDNVEFVGWVEFSKVPSYITASDICLIPHNASGHTHTTIPHKLFQYMIFKKPVIVTDCIPLKRIVEECKCGVVIPSKDHNELAKGVISLFENKEYAKQLGENGRKAVKQKYNWENAGTNLVGLYRSLGDENIGSKIQ
jgi:glycosyltransferase involved in cell wall biosynthesis